MIMRNKKKLLRIIVIVILIVFTIFSFYDFIHLTNQFNTNTTLDHLKDVGKETANNYNQKFTTMSQYLKITSRLIEEEYNSEKDISDILSNLEKNQIMFQRLWYVDNNKIVHNYKEKIEFKAVNNYVDLMLEGQSGITDPFESPYNHKLVIVVYNPIYKDGSIHGGIIGIVEINDENRDLIYNDVFNNEAYVFATASDGHIISKIKNHNTIYDGDNYLEFLKSHVNYIDGSYEEINDNIKKNKSGYVTYDYKSNQSRIVYYTPVKINNWYVFTVISRDIVIQKNEQTNHIAFMLIIKIIIVFIVLTILIVLYFRKINKINKDINKKLEASNRKIDVILKQTNDRIFEYSIDKDSLTLDAWNDYPKVMLNSFLSNLHNYNFVSKEHENLLKEKFREIIDNKNKIVFDAKFPYISKDDKTWFHVSIIYIEENHKLIGTLKNSTEEMEEYNILLQDHMFKNAIYSNALAMFAVNLKSKKVVIYQMDGYYHNAIDVEYNDQFISILESKAYSSDKERVKRFFNYDRIQNLYHHHEGINRIDYRSYNEKLDKYVWIRYRIQFERQSSNNELLMIAYANNINEEKLKQLENEFKAQRDGLTGLYNRQTFNQLVDTYLKNNNSAICYNAYMIVDLDNFKKINDTLGHSYGDQIIQKVAKILEENCYDNGYIGRFGGDEFVIFLYNQESYAMIENKARQILKQIDSIEIERNFECSASIGITFVKNEKSHSYLFDKCDQALYVCKNSGKNRFYVFNDNEDTDL